MAEQSASPRDVPSSGVAVGLVIAAAAWVFAVPRMSGMSMSPRDLGSVSFFAVTWTAMMAAMMLPTAIPAFASMSAGGRRTTAAAAYALQFILIYVGAWALIGLVAYGAHRGVQSTHPRSLIWGRSGHY